MSSYNLKLNLTTAFDNAKRRQPFQPWEFSIVNVMYQNLFHMWGLFKTWLDNFTPRHFVASQTGLSRSRELITNEILAWANMMNCCINILIIVNEPFYTLNEDEQYREPKFEDLEAFVLREVCRISYELHTKIRHQRISPTGYIIKIPSFSTGLKLLL